MDKHKVEPNSTTITIRLPKTLLEKMPAPTGKGWQVGGRSAYIRGLIVKNIEASNAGNAAQQGL